MEWSRLSCNRAIDGYTILEHANEHFGFEADTDDPVYRISNKQIPQPSPHLVSSSAHVPSSATTSTDDDHHDAADDDGSTSAYIQISRLDNSRTKYDPVNNVIFFEERLSILTVVLSLLKL